MKEQGIDWGSIVYFLTYDNGANLVQIRMQSLRFILDFVPALKIRPLNHNIIKLMWEDSAEA